MPAQQPSPAQVTGNRLKQQWQKAHWQYGQDEPLISTPAAPQNDLKYKAVLQLYCGVTCTVTQFMISMPDAAESRQMDGYGSLSITTKL